MDSSATPSIGEYSGTLARVLSARGLTRQSELDYHLKQLLAPNLLSHIDDAAELLAEAVIADASIVIVGDFDADGATSCALAMRCLRVFGLRNISYLVPNRFQFGYGLSPEIVGVAASRQPDIIITVDNGISSIDGVHAAQQLGISVLVTDHHLPGEELPTADVIVNPNLKGDRFPSKNLAGVGVIFYVMLALRAKLRQMDWFTQANIKMPNMSQFLDLVALGTVADVVPLDQNNRILVHQGLQRIRQGNGCSAGIIALLNVANRNSQRIVASDLGFAVGPRLNAAGRLEDMSLGIECLLCDDLDQAMTLAQQLDDLNKQRREVEQSMQQDALAIVENLDLQQNDSPVIYTLYDEGWHQGVVGLVASRIKEQTQRPVLAFAPSEQAGEWKGSARSVEGVHIRDILARVDALCPNLLDKFGGHAMAAGLTVQDNKLADFIDAIQSVMQQATENREWRQIIWTDGSLSEGDLSMDFAEQLRDITPWGQAFPEPVFEGEFEVVDARVVGDVHAKLRLRPLLSGQESTQQQIEAIYFSYMNTHDALPKDNIKAVYRLDVNEFREQFTLQLMLQYIESIPA